jgi:hypothetical protein
MSTVERISTVFPHRGIAIASFLYLSYRTATIMKKTVSSIRVVVLALAVTTIRPAYADWLADIVNFISSPVTGTVADILEDGCQSTIDGLFNNSGIDCSCDGSFTVTAGLDLTLACGIPEGLCLFDFCGFPSLELVVTPTGIHKFGTCLTFEKNETLQIDAPEPFCLTAYGSDIFSDTPFAITGCEVELDGDACECIVCENQLSLKYDCSMNTVKTPQFENTTDVPGPKMDLCLGVGTVEEVWGFFFPPPPTPAPTITPTASPMPSDMPSMYPSTEPSYSPVDKEEDDFWDFLPWNWD